ncbi:MULTISPECIES: flavodoxin family protein [unclassified Pseudodesulfovibrio]|uniref:flavodoxin family protein n=1 Tax=unclassified Pseudodesulfovibrio TaxID=2661612 RepID=UPI000FEB6B7C|nr:MULTISPECIES: flavodoxin family protein [unclassified Pseudodesulfovibrio]MCJ2165441.1 flavodoxin family protein [Pseudodesulfovibrio sp. S3-i]RWU03191.1 flavodoxin family protein [Pseudodesulfovibrio sp. S3]
MKLLAFNGSPRKKKWNTVTMLEHALEGAREAGAETELVHLYALDFKGCASCFSCKRHDRTATGVCVLKDDLKPILEQVRTADAIILGSPVYYSCETACARAFLERLQFPYLNYANYEESHFPRHMPTGLIYTMNVPAAHHAEWGYDVIFERTRSIMARHFGSCELVIADNTVQYDDYDKYETGFDKNKKAAHRAEFFAKQCQQAKEMGARLITGQK